MTETLNVREFKDLDSSQLLSEVQKSREAAIELGIRWADSNKRFKDLKELMPSMLAEIHLICLENDIPATKAKLQALSAMAYQNKIKEMNEAEHQARLLEIEYKAHIKTLEALSAISYVKNNELKALR